MATKYNLFMPTESQRKALSHWKSKFVFALNTFIYRGAIEQNKLPQISYTAWILRMKKKIMWLIFGHSCRDQDFRVPSSMLDSLSRVTSVTAQQLVFCK